MKIFLYFIVILVFFNSCSIFRNGANIEKSEKKVKLLDINKYKSDVLVAIYFKDEFELHVPILLLAKYTWFSNIHVFNKFYNLVDSLYNKTNNYKNIHYISDFSFASMVNIYEYFIIDHHHLFLSGKYMIYDTSTNTYIDEVFIKESSWYGGPLAAHYSFTVYIHKKIFFWYLVQS